MLSNGEPQDVLDSDQADKSAVVLNENHARAARANELIQTPGCAIGSPHPLEQLHDYLQGEVRGDRKRCLRVNEKLGSSKNREANVPG